MVGKFGRLVGNSVFMLGLILSLFLPTNTAHAERFEMAGNIPQAYNINSVKYFTNAGFTVGLYSFSDNTIDEIPLTGFLIKDRFFFINEPIASCFGDIHYGLTDRYFLMDGFAYGASHNRTMHLLGYSGDSIQLYDTIHQGFVGENSMDFQSARTDKNIYGYVDNPNPASWMEIRDVDGDGRLEIKVGISVWEHLAFPNFELYFEIKNDRLRVDFNPSLYKKLYDEIGKSGEKSPAYYVYGVLAGLLDLDKLRLESRNNKDLSSFVKLLEERHMWDKAFHEFAGDRPRLTLFNTAYRR